MANLGDTTIRGILRVFGSLKVTEVVGKLTGNADTSTKFSSNRKITLSGDVSGSYTGDFASDINIPIVVEDGSHNHSFGNMTDVNGVTRGGTGLNAMAIDTMLYASAANTLSTFATTSYGRSLLTAITGTKFVGLNADLVDDLHVHGDDGYGMAWGYIPRVATSGVLDIGKYIDFHEVSGDTTTDNTARITASGGELNSNVKFNATVLKADTKINVANAFELVYNSATKSLDINCLV